MTTEIQPASNEELNSKMQELMVSLDQVKKYKELSHSMLDLLLIICGSIIAALFVFLSANLYSVLFGNFVSGFFLSVPVVFLSGGVFIAGLLIGTLVVDRRVNRVKTGEWKGALNENQGVPGALKLLSSLDWDSTFRDIQISKTGFLIYGFLKIIGYWLFTFFLLEVLNGIFVQALIHTLINSAYVGVVALVVVLAGSWSDLNFRYNQSWSLDSLLWELRWFDSEFRRAESDFEA